MEQLAHLLYICNFAVGFSRRFFLKKSLHGCKLFPIFAVLLLDPLFSLSFCTVFDLELILCLFSNVRRLARWTFFYVSRENIFFFCGK